MGDDSSFPFLWPSDTRFASVLPLTTQQVSLENPRFWLIKFPRSMSVMRVADAGNGGSKGAKDVEFGAAYFGSQLLQGSSEVSNVVQGIKEQTTRNVENHWLRCSVISQGGLGRRIPPPAFVQSIYVRSCRNPHSRLADSNPTSMFQNDCIYTIMLTSLTFIYLCNR